MRIAVAGAGIAGLTAALALVRTGHEVTVLERADPIEAVGAGIQLSPNATKVMRALGLERAINAHASAPREIAIRDGWTGGSLTRVPLGAEIEKRHGAPYLTIHRGDLQRVLLDAAEAEPRVAVRTGAAIRLATPDGSLATDSGTETFDLILGADGVRSTLRAAVHDGEADWRGATAWRSIVPTDALPRALAGPRTGVWLAPGAHLVHYPIRSGTRTNLVAVLPASGDAEFPFGAFARWHGDARAILAAATDWRPWPTPQLDPSHRWSRGRIVLIGDAAHAMWPYAAQGGAMAIEDGWTLAAALANGMEALPAWEASRRMRVSAVARTAARNRAIYHLRGPARLARNLAMRLAPPAALTRAMGGIYSWEPPAIRSRP